MSGAVRCRACLGIAVAVTLVSRVEVRNVGRSKRDATKTGYRSFGLVLQPLNGNEWLLCQRSVHEVDADTPPGDCRVCQSQRDSRAPHRRRAASDTIFANLEACPCRDVASSLTTEPSVGSVGLKRGLSEEFLNEVIQRLLPFRRVMSVAGHMPDVRHVVLPQVSVDSLADVDESVLVAAGKPE
jgi:hypothetical protein